MKKYLSIILLASAICCTAQTTEEVRKELQRQGVPCAEVVLRQARLETGNFTSKLCKSKHNIFGIKRGKKYAAYKDWRECVKDYKRRISSRYNGGDYYAFLQRIGYAADKRYIAKLKSL